jgi:hypothetical protein
METILGVLMGIAISLIYAFVLSIAVWTPKDKMKGHAGRGKCKCCNN